MLVEGNLIKYVLGVDDSHENFTLNEFIDKGTKGCRKTTRSLQRQMFRSRRKLCRAGQDNSKAIYYVGLSQQISQFLFDLNH